jgi:hypothetical protein
MKYKNGFGDLTGIMTANIKGKCKWHRAQSKGNRNKWTHEESCRE